MTGTDLICSVKKGNGLSNMQERISADNGKFVIRSLPGEGTELIVSFTS